MAIVVWVKLQSYLCVGSPPFSVADGRLLRKQEREEERMLSLCGWRIGWPRDFFLLWLIAKRWSSCSFFSYYHHILLWSWHAYRDSPTLQAKPITGGRRQLITSSCRSQPVNISKWVANLLA